MKEIEQELITLPEECFIEADAARLVEECPDQVAEPGGVRGRRDDLADGGGVASRDRTLTEQHLAERALDVGGRAQPSGRREDQFQG